ncbi:MAG: MBL fold metallo-hydrolase [Candidatus Odinarchaeia archaeon]
MEVLDGIIYIPGKFFDSNVYVIGKNELTLIDCGTGGNVNYLFDTIKKMNLDPENIKQIVLTHLHYDHIGGLNEILKVIKPKIYASELEAPFIESANSKLILLDMFGASFSPVKIDVRIHDGDLIACEGFTFKVIHTPGHSLGSICLYNDENKVLISGDTVFAGGSFGRVDLPSGSLQDLIKSINKLNKLNVKYLLPGHNEISVDGKKDIKNVLNLLETYY